MRIDLGEGRVRKEVNSDNSEEKVTEMQTKKKNEKAAAGLGAIACAVVLYRKFNYKISERKLIYKGKGGVVRKL